MESELAIAPVPRNESELIKQVGDWATYNFGRQRAPDLGIIEEIGEATHAVLKRRQRIRGFEKENVFVENFADSVADATIFLADYANIHGAFFSFGRNEHAVARAPDERRILAHLLQATGQLFAFDEITVEDKVEVYMQQIYNQVVQRICTGLEAWALYHNLDLRLLVTNVWEKVKRRNWRKDSVNAGVGA